MLIATPFGPVKTSRFPLMALLAVAVLIAAGLLLPAAPLMAGSGTVWACGDNDYGQIGDGTTINRLLPVQVPGPGGTGVLSSIQGVSAGYRHAIAVKNDGTLWTWGDNVYWELAQFNNYPYQSGPVQVRGPGGAGFFSGGQAVAAGFMFSVALKSDGAVWAWGCNNRGQLGGGNTSITSFYGQVQGPDGVGVLTDVRTVAAGFMFSVALKSDGTVWAWGSNGGGQLGDGTTTNELVPVQVRGPGGSGFLSDVQAVAAGSEYCVALKNDGTVWTWGSNNGGQLGDGTTTNKLVPVQVRGPGGVGFLSGVQAVAAGNGHTVALKSDGIVLAWGYNSAGQLGDGTTVYQSFPVQVRGPGGVGFLSGVQAVAAGNGHTVALKSDGIVLAWGYNGAGQLGDGTVTDRHAPVQVKSPDGSGFLSGILAVAAGGNNTFAIKNNVHLTVVGGTGSGDYLPGTLVTISATIPEGNAFANWTTDAGSDLVTDPASATTTITVNGDATVTAHLVHNGVTVTVSQASLGAPYGSPATFVSRDWVYQNTPVTTGGRHRIYLSLTVSGSSSYTVAVTQDATSMGTVDIAPTTGNPLVWTIIGSARQNDGTTGTKLVKLNVTVTDTPSGAVGTTQVRVMSRLLGDVDFHGGLTGQDRLLINKRLNGLVPDGPEFDLDGVGGSNGQDKLILNKVLNGLQIP